MTGTRKKTGRRKPQAGRGGSGSRGLGSVSAQVAFRLPEGLLERLDDHVTRMREESPGLKVTRADAVRVLLTRALDQIEAEGD